MLVTNSYMDNMQTALAHCLTVCDSTAGSAECGARKQSQEPNQGCRACQLFQCCVKLQATHATAWADHITKIAVAPIHTRHACTLSFTQHDLCSLLMQSRRTDDPSEADRSQSFSLSSRPGPGQMPQQDLPAPVRHLVKDPALQAMAADAAGKVADAVRCTPWQAVGDTL